MICPKCKKQVTQKEEIEFLKNVGECVSCDHITGEIQEDQKEYDQRHKSN